MWDPRPGDLLCCIEDALSEDLGIPHPTGGRYCGGMDGLSKGQIYTVREIGRSHIPGHDEPLVRLEEIVREAGDGDLAEPGYSLWRFRPVSKTRSEEFHRLVAPVTTRKREHA